MSLVFWLSPRIAVCLFLRNCILWDTCILRARPCILKFVFLSLKDQELNNCRTLKQINIGWFASPTISNILVDILQPWSIVAKTFISHVTGFLVLPVIKDTFTNALVRVLKSSKRPIRYLYGYLVTIEQTPLKSTAKKIMFSKVVGSNLQSYSKINSFTGTSLGKYEGWFNYNFVS